MARKTSKTATATDEVQPETTGTTAMGNGSSTRKPAARKRATKAIAKKSGAKKSAATKKPAARKSGTAAAPQKQQQRTAPSDDEIRLRAYFIAEWRHKESIPGDAAHDWIEARRQLVAEAGLE